jgi:BBSome-interacting protein 1
MAANVNTFKEILPKTGLLHHEATYSFVLCKPKIMPLKSITLEKLEKMQKEAQELVRDQVGFLVYVVHTSSTYIYLN